MAESNDKRKKFTIFIKTQKSKEKISVEVDENTTILEIKILISSQTNAAPDEISLIFAGKIMKDTEVVSAHNIQDGYTIHMVLRPRVTETTSGASTSSASTTTAPIMPSTGLADTQQNANVAFPDLESIFGLAGLGNLNIHDIRNQVENEMMQNPDVLRQFVSNPLVQGLISDPENIRMFVTSNPQIRELIDRNPEINHIINSPELLRQTMELARNPAMLQELMRSHDRAISNLESIPGGYNALQRMYRDIQEPMINAATEQHNPFLGLVSGASQNPIDNPQQGTENRRPLPNPWSPNSSRTSNPTSPATTPIPGTGPAPGNPMVQNFMQQMSENPEVFQNLMQSPHMQSMIQNITNDPNFASLLQQTRGPGNLRNIAEQLFGGQNNAQLQNLFGNPQAMLDLFQITRGINNLHIPPTSGQNISTTSTPTTSAASTASPESSGDRSTNSENRPTGFVPPPRVPLVTDEPPEQLYRAQLGQLEAMGFVDQQANIRALISAFGDINVAVDRLLNQNPS